MLYRANGLQQVEVFHSKPVSRALALLGGDHIVKHKIKTPRGHKVIASIRRNHPLILPTEDPEQQIWEMQHGGGHLPRPYYGMDTTLGSDPLRYPWLYVHPDIRARCVTIEPG